MVLPSRTAVDQRDRWPPAELGSLDDDRHPSTSNHRRVPFAASRMARSSATIVPAYEHIAAIVST
jgi:hypothetical protein